MQWREPEKEVILVCKGPGIGFVPWSPVGAGFLGDHFGTLGLADSAEVELDRFLGIRPDFMPMLPATVRPMARLRLALDGALPHERVVDDAALIESRLSGTGFPFRRPRAGAER